MALAVLETQETQETQAMLEPLAVGVRVEAEVGQHSHLPL
jgi:hypothetical protein